MSRNVYNVRFDGEIAKPATADSPCRPTVPQPSRAASRCDRIIALIDDGLARAEGTRIDVSTPLDLEIDEVVDGRASPQVFAAHDHAGQYYLAAQTGRTPAATTWLCAPTSRLAQRCVLTGKAQPRDAFLHSQTGYVVIVTLDSRGAETTSIRLCADVSHDLLP